MNEPRVASIHLGKVAPLGPDGVPSGFVKHGVSSAVNVTPLGIVGDEQADLRVHGGPDKAVYGYASAHYAAWRHDYPQHTDLLVAGGLGENLSIDGMTEAELCVGDVHAIGTTRMQVCQPRQPCFKFAQTTAAEGGKFQGAKNVVLVHGAWADGSSWSKLIPLLEAQGLHVVAVQNPLTSLVDDVATTKRAIALQDGPVLLVGHSYGGAVITEAGNDPKVIGLVYVAAFAPNDGEALVELGKEFPVPPGNAEAKPDEAGFISLTQKGVVEDFAQDLPLSERRVMAATQGPTSINAFTQKISIAAWKTKPSWYVVAQNDRMIAPAFEVAMAKTIKAKSITLPSSHVPMLSHPDEVAVLITEAAEALKAR